MPQECTHHFSNNFYKMYSQIFLTLMNHLSTALSHYTVIIALKKTWKEFARAEKHTDDPSPWDKGGSPDDAEGKVATEAAAAVAEPTIQKHH